MWNFMNTFCKTKNWRWKNKRGFLRISWQDQTYIVKQINKPQRPSRELFRKLFRRSTEFLFSKNLQKQQQNLKPLHQKWTKNKLLFKLTIFIPSAYGYRGYMSLDMIITCLIEITALEPRSLWFKCVSRHLESI